MGQIATVYDVMDTVGQKPEDVSSFFVIGPTTKDDIEKYVKLLDRRNIHCELIDAGDGNAGSIRVSKNGNEETPTEYTLKINENHEPQKQFVTLAHELGHLFLGHLGTNEKLKIRKHRSVEYSVREIESESVAFLVSARNGVYAKSEIYLADHVKNDTCVEKIDLYLIMKAVGDIEKLLNLKNHTSFGRKSRKRDCKTMNRLYRTDT